MASSEFYPRPHFTVDTACLPARVSFDLKTANAVLTPSPSCWTDSLCTGSRTWCSKKIQRNRAVTTNVTAGPRIRLRCVTRFRETSKLDARGVGCKQVGSRNEWTTYVLRSFPSSFNSKKKAVKSIIVSLPSHCVENFDTRTRPQMSRRNCRRCSRIENRRSQASPDPLRV